MSLEDLKADLESNMTEMAALAATGPLISAQELAHHLDKTLWPFMANLVAELEDVDGVVDDLYRGAEDILQPETAKEFAAVIAVASGLISGVLKPLLNPKDPVHARHLLAIKEWEKLAEGAAVTIEDITVVALAEDDDGEEGEEEEDDEEGDDDEEDDEDEDGDEPADPKENA